MCIVINEKTLAVLYLKNPQEIKKLSGMGKIAVEVCRFDIRRNSTDIECSCFYHGVFDMDYEGLLSYAETLHHRYNGETLELFTQNGYKYSEENITLTQDFCVNFNKSEEKQIMTDNTNATSTKTQAAANDGHFSRNAGKYKTVAFMLLAALVGFGVARSMDCVCEVPETDNKV